MMSQPAPTNEFLISVLWLGLPRPDGNVVPAGSGVVVHHHGGEYLATASHVAKDCSFQPFVRRHGQWGQAQWETIGTNEDADIAVLRTSTANLSHLTPQYGFAHTVLGAIGRALGFPALSNPTEISHVAEIEGMPIPLTTLVSTYLRLDASAESSVQYMGGVHQRWVLWWSCLAANQQRGLEHRRNYYPPRGAYEKSL